VVYVVDFLPQWSDLPASPESCYGSLSELLHRLFGAPVAAALAMIRPDSATASLAKHLRIRLGDLLLVLHQRHELGDGRTILFSIDYVRNDVFTIYVHRSPGVGSLPRGSLIPGGKSRPDLQEESHV
jgi:DNA-binding GntR family transcriptional regulator